MFCGSVPSCRRSLSQRRITLVASSASRSHQPTDTLRSCQNFQNCTETAYFSPPTRVLVQSTPRDWKMRCCATVRSRSSPKRVAQNMRCAREGRRVTAKGGEAGPRRATTTDLFFEDAIFDHKLVWGRTRPDALGPRGSPSRRAPDAGSADRGLRRSRAPPTPRPARRRQQLRRRSCSST